MHSGCACTWRVAQMWTLVNCHVVVFTSNAMLCYSIRQVTFYYLVKPTDSPDGGFMHQEGNLSPLIWNPEELKNVQATVK